MLRTIDLRGSADLAALLPARSSVHAGPVGVVEAILADVRDHGDAALRRLTLRLDGVDRESTRVSAAECTAALKRLDRDLRAALEAAHSSIVSYHRTQLHDPVDLLDGGVRLRSYALPVDRAGCYVPGGTAPLASTVLMTASIAAVAGVPEVVLVTPPDRALGRPVDAVLAAAAIAGVHEVHAVGGAQAIAALAYGTESIRPVDVIVGPGNVYVSVAKRIVAAEGCVGVPSSFAGPSEVVVIADHTAPPRFAAIDVVLQAEHGPDGSAWLVTWDEVVAERVLAEIVAITEASPRRRDLEANFAARGFVALVDDAVQAAEVANLLAPEHLELLVADPEAMLPMLRHAGAIFTGEFSPASLGDYIAGPSHVLPTDRSARFGSALTVSDFQKHMHVVTANRAGLDRLAPHVIALAEAEGLPAHADSIRFRLGQP